MRYGLCMGDEPQSICHVARCVLFFSCARTATLNPLTRCSRYHRLYSVCKVRSLAPYRVSVFSGTSSANWNGDCDIFCRKALFASLRRILCRNFKSQQVDRHLLLCR